jgi:hypothetical protein
VNEPVDAVVRAAMKLPPRQRRAAVEKIIIETSAEGDGTAQDEVERLWAAEIDRRVRSIQRDPTRGVPLAAAEKLVDAELSRRRETRRKAAAKRARSPRR